MDDLDSLLQDLEKATSSLKNPSGGGGGGGSWKLGKPVQDPTTTSAYSSAKVAKRYSPQYYVNDEPLYQNDPSSFRRSQSNQSSYNNYHANHHLNDNNHDYAAINGRGSSSNMNSSNPASPIYEVPNGGPTYAQINGQQRQTPIHRNTSTDSDQVNDLIKNLEYNLQNPSRAGVSSPATSSSMYSKPIGSSTPIANGGGSMPRSTSQSPVQAARIQPVSEYNRQLVNISPQRARMDNNPVIQIPLNAHGTSNATRELDDLMASLSDFKINQQKVPGKNQNYIALGKIQVPVKSETAPILRASPSDDLDSMIGNLETDLKRQGISTTAKGDCKACGRAIVGQVITALGTTWHPEHFTCAICQRELGEGTFFERDGVAYCERDYHQLFSPQCAYCNKPIYDRCITALDKTWHPEHFCCAHCGKNFGDEGYHEKSGNAYCRDDFFKLFAPKCSGCAKPIEDNYVTALGGQWHQECFVCRDCKSPFTEGKSYFDFEGRPYCEPHYHDKRGNLCCSCRQPINGRCITAMGKKYHPEHFTCSFCLKQLNKGTFKKHNEKPYCHSCFDKLFA